MKALALVMALAVPCWADDAPKALCLEPSDRIALAQSLAARDARIDSLEKAVTAAPSTALVVVLVVAGVVAGGALGVAGGLALARKP